MTLCTFLYWWTEKNYPYFRNIFLLLRNVIVWCEGSWDICQLQGGHLSLQSQDLARVLLLREGTVWCNQMGTVIFGHVVLVFDNIKLIIIQIQTYLQFKTTYPEQLIFSSSFVIRAGTPPYHLRIRIRKFVIKDLDPGDKYSLDLDQN